MSDLETIIQKLVRQELQEQMPVIIARALDEDRRAHTEAEQASGGTMPDRMSVKEAAAAARRHDATIRVALEGGELHGVQRVARGKWMIERQCLLAWMEGDPCIHKQNVSPLRPRRPKN
ncbi:helix-turn-helix domain-containing protein [Clavibacter californiensis]|uniref:Helix-turn-helix domain-containing protein n=1 Tax=Clavibacter californiensis TaxID=1401995 RepID=A0ABX9NDJ6_9MICO|nr:helix-turn-helix domain-containing protein [Clavibacter californiensis]RII94568.1 helix-turn-helix domain-containing protein [Clavibacter californiensis]UKF78906.1 helix-turn-helix domain-containing protein [Clavibacter californiensis]